ncbi:TRP-domain-containing protein [Choiromyces venosus 120613-1]|uniref:TRP-domain-containing protein n=1 Tax=Choiromyces venosus 120613-1 TaxID=1336337 RepID=A0A3N4JK14_9PEZI|nr:TRP-domain-containing protein [Choiromyces venosus 120613-1]
MGEGFQGMCPMQQGLIQLESHTPIEANVASQIPAIAYQVPDIDGKARIMVNRTDTKQMIACVEAPLSNGKTVDTKGVGWATAIIAGMGLIASAVTSGLGHSNTAAHVAANALSLFGYFQAQAMIGMTGVTLPPIVAAWTQNFDWSMGIIRVGFMQEIFHWYIQATGGKPANIFGSLSEVSVQIMKRSLPEQTSTLISRAAAYGFDTYASPLAPRGLEPRSNNDNGLNDKTETLKVWGIKRVSFKAKIEATNFFMTGLAFLVAFLVFVALGVCAFKALCEFASKMQWIKGTKFQDFRNGWMTVLKGIMYRLVLIGYPQMAILCLWELTVRDSGGAVTLAIFFFFSMTGILAWASFKVIRIAQRSVTLHKNPAYILYSDPAALNRWGFLYVQFRATAYYYVVPVLLYTLVKAMFIAFAQNKGTVQAIALLLIEVAYLIAVSIMRPWMDKRTNIFNISICAINFLNTVFLLVFTNVFGGPGIVIGVMGVIFFILNAAFALVLLILVLISSIYALISKNPDVRYQPMRDDRASFIKSNSHMATSTELDALGVTARGDLKSGYKRDLEDDDSYTTHSMNKEASQIPLPPSTAGSHAPPSPLSSAVPMFPAAGHDGSRGPYNNQMAQHSNQLPLLTTAGTPRSPSRGGTPSPVRSPGGYDYNLPVQRSNTGGSMNWHTGAGYDGHAH